MDAEAPPVADEFVRILRSEGRRAARWRVAAPIEDLGEPHPRVDVEDRGDLDVPTVSVAAGIDAPYPGALRSESHRLLP